MILAEVLAKASPRKFIHILDKDNTTYYLGMVKDCPVELYNLKVYDVAGCYVRIMPQKKQE